jgi:hypothetical protein
MRDGFDDAVRGVAEAFAEYIDKRVELATAMDRYDGYSPDYHLSYQIAARNDAETALRDAFARLLGPYRTGVPDAR